MGDPRPDFTDGVVAGLVTGQVHEHPETASRQSVACHDGPDPRTFERRDVDAARTRFHRSRPGPI